MFGNFFNQIALADSLVLGVMSDFPVTIHFKSGDPDLTVPAVQKNPAMEEDYVPGSAAVLGQGTTHLLLFVKFSGTSAYPGILQQTASLVNPNGVPTGNGDTATVNGVVYDIFQVDVDREGGCTLRMRRVSDA